MQITGLVAWKDLNAVFDWKTFNRTWKAGVLKPVALFKDKRKQAKGEYIFKAKEAFSSFLIVFYLFCSLIDIFTTCLIIKKTESGGVKIEWDIIAWC